MAEFKVGDTVRLNSGGPLMTVEGFGTYDGEQKVQCVWFVKTETKRGTFPPAVLKADDGQVHFA